MTNFVQTLGLPPITLDLAAEPGTAVCEDYFGPGGRIEDSLTAKWVPLRRGLMFLNPPFSRTCRDCADRTWKGKKLPSGKPRPKSQQCAHRGHTSSTVTDWVAKAADVGTSGQKLALLVPARVGTEWFHTHIMGLAVSVHFIRGRHRFLVPAGGGLQPYKDPAAFPTMLACFDGTPARRRNLVRQTTFGSLTPDGGAPEDAASTQRGTADKRTIPASWLR